MKVIFFRQHEEIVIEKGLKDLSIECSPVQKKWLEMLLKLDKYKMYAVVSMDIDVLNVEVRKGIEVRFHCNSSRYIGMHIIEVDADQKIDWDGVFQGMRMTLTEKLNEVSLTLRCLSDQLSSLK